MSFAIWFILLGVISLGIGALVQPWLESRTFRFIILPPVIISGLCRLAGARLAGIPVKEKRILGGEGRGVRVDTSGAPWHRILILSLFSFCSPMAIVLAANALSGWPLWLNSELPFLLRDSRAIVQVGEQTGLYLRDIWHLLRTMAYDNPLSLLWAYFLVGVLLSNTPGKRESTPLWLAAVCLGLLDRFGVMIRSGSQGFLAYRYVWVGLSILFAFSLLTLLIGIGLAAIHRTRTGPDSDRGR